MLIRVVVLLVLASLLSACGMFGPPEPPAPIVERTSRTAAPQAAARVPPPVAAPAPVAKAIPLPDDQAPVALPRGRAGAEPERGFIIETPRYPVPGEKPAASTGPMLPPGAEPLPPEEPGGDAQGELAPANAAPALSPAVQSLVASADAAAAEQNWDRAQASLERAVKLAPSKSVVWQKLARTHLKSGNLERAREVAQRALTLAPADSAEKASTWQLIGEIEQARGDGAAAQAARASAAAISAP